MLWYQAKGNESDTVLSSRVRFARNLSGYRFDARLAEKDAKEIIEKVGAALGDGFTKVNFDDRSPMAAESPHVSKKRCATHAEKNTER